MASSERSAIRSASTLAAAPRSLRRCHSALPLSFVGRDFSPALNRRAVARYRSRCSAIFVSRCSLPRSRAKYSPSVLTNQPSLEIHAPKGGTVNRPLARVSHRKQTVEHTQGRNVPVHTFCTHFNRSAIAHSPRRLAVSQRNARLYYESRCLIRPMCSVLPSANQQSGDIDHAFLPETANRVETDISHRKQTVAYAATRDWGKPFEPAERIVEFTFVLRSATARAVPPVCLDAEQSARWVSLCFSQITNHESLMTKSPLTNPAPADAIIIEAITKSAGNAVKRNWA